MSKSRGTFRTVTDLTGNRKTVNKEAVLKQNLETKGRKTYQILYRIKPIIAPFIDGMKGLCKALGCPEPENFFFFLLPCFIEKEECMLNKSRMDAPWKFCVPSLYNYDLSQILEELSLKYPEDLVRLHTNTDFETIFRERKGLFENILAEHENLENRFLELTKQWFKK